MKVSVFLEYRFCCTPDGRGWSETSFAHSFWLRYLEVFDGVTVVARATLADRPPPGWREVTGAGVSFAKLPFYIGPLGFARNYFALRRPARSAVGREDAVIFRLGSALADLVLPAYKRQGRPYGVEVVGDPWDVFSPGASTHPLRPLFRRWFAYRLRRQCAGASAAAYVTAETLERRYPPGDGAYAESYSSIELGSDAFASAARAPRKERGTFHLVTVGTMSQPYKGYDCLLEAFAERVRAGDDLELVIVGDGRLQPEYQSKVEEAGLVNRVNFVGRLPAGEPVREQLDRADLFVLPSLTEGLPRAMIEAMARGLPCIGTSVGGIPELLEPEDMFPPGDSRSLAAMINDVLSDPERLGVMSARNLEKAVAYSNEKLAPRRRAFYRHLRETTRKWLGDRAL